MTFDTATNCGCACHKTVERVVIGGRGGWSIDYHWPAYTDPIARVTACPRCELQHDRAVGLIDQATEHFRAQQVKHRLTRYLRGA